MFIIPLILAAGSLSTLISGAPVPSFLSHTDTKLSSSPFLQERSSNAYTTYGGSGEASVGWPSQSDWVSSFETMFNNNLATMQSSCAQWNVADTTDDEAKAISSAITSVASSTGIDARFILAIMMQESNGCVRVPTTNYGVRNPGLMQSHNGAGTCNDASVQSPCASAEITQMIQDGAGGTSSGDGLKQCLAESGASDVSMYYKAARIYNSGSIASGGNLGEGVATHCYASDVANRLTGWSSGLSGCNSGTVANVVNTASSTSGSSESAVGSSASTTTVAAVAAAASTPAPAPAPAPSAAAEPLTTGTTGTSTSTTGTEKSSSESTSSTTTSTTANTSSAETYPGATSTCQEWYTVQAGDDCLIVEGYYSISMADLMSWNSGLDSVCSNLWLGYQYCVKA